MALSLLRLLFFTINIINYLFVRKHKYLTPLDLGNKENVSINFIPIYFVILLMFENNVKIRFAFVFENRRRPFLLM